MFKKEFKYYKSRSLLPKFDDVVDFHLSANNLFNKVVRRPSHIPSEHISYSKYGLTEVQSWELFEFKNKPGLFYILNPFTREGQQYWVQRCLQEYTKKPNRLNLDPFNELEPDEEWWETVQIDNERGRRLKNKLRWATLGYHHNWDTKEYSESAHDEFPSDLGELSRLVVQVLGDTFSDGYQAEAAIINFYHLDSTLSGHQDVSEPNMTSPLVSISFGQSAIFLVGGVTLDDPTTAVFLHSGDIVVMSGPARHFYHGVPRIVLTENKPWAGDGWESTCCGNYLETSRINMNVRQVLPPGGRLVKKIKS